jgi:hypothetical protein
VPIIQRVNGPVSVSVPIKKLKRSVPGIKRIKGAVTWIKKIERSVPGI